MQTVSMNVILLNIRPIKYYPVIIYLHKDKVSQKLNTN